MHIICFIEMTNVKHLYNFKYKHACKVSTVTKCDWKPDCKQSMVVIVGEAFKPVKQEADCHDRQIDEFLNIHVRILET